MPLVSIICPCYNEEKNIGRCIESMLHQDMRLDSMELLFVDGNSTDRTREIVTSYVHRYPFIHLLDNPHRTAPYAMNIGIKAAKGEIVVRIDAHAAFPTNYISSLTHALQTLPNAANVGGVCRTIPAKNSAMCCAIAETMSHPFGVGNSMFRIGANEIMEVDTVPFGCYYKKQLEQIGMYDEELTRNQDDELNARIIQHGGVIYLLSSIQIDYIARDTLSKMSRMFYQYGLFKPLVNKKLSSPATLRQFVPPLFVLGTMIGIAMCFAFPVLWIVFTLVYCIYIAIGITVGVQLALKHKKILLSILIPLCFFVLHWSYGIGYWNGLYKVALNKPFNVSINR